MPKSKLTPAGERGGKSSKRRQESECRNEYLDQGAVLLDIKRLDGKHLGHYDQWLKIQKYGFRVTTDGCLVPYRQFRPKKGQSGTKVGYRASAICFNHVDVKRLGKVDPERRNPDGWPSELQISHLCHVESCCNPSHLVVEERWKNLKRNYCGSTGRCECPFAVKCVLPYRSSSAEREVSLVTYESKEMKAQIRKALPETVTVNVLPRHYYKVQDEKRVNQLKRKKSTKHHKNQAARKRAKGLFA